MVMDGDAGVVESGGKCDFQDGDDATFRYPADYGLNREQAFVSELQKQTGPTTK
jgi:hypothetical protein